eukprot:3027228-Rhodomonas_salina.1
MAVHALGRRDIALAKVKHLVPMPQISTRHIVPQYRTSYRTHRTAVPEFSTGQIGPTYTTSVPDTWYHHALPQYRTA